MDAVEEVKQRLAIEDVIGEYVELKRSGRNYKGLSPFNAEKSPSFVVSPEKQIWHDFSSGKGGNVFSFVMEVEGLDFRAALELLARKAGVDLDQFKGATRGDSRYKERLYETLELATKFYQKQFTGSAEALDYVLKKRGYTRETVLEWRIGYSPNTGDALVSFLQKHGFSTTEIKDAGLSSQRYRGLGDMFRGRIMIPLADQQGRIIGFTARLLIDKPNAPKYINTPQTPLYDKSRHIFGLHLAKEAIRKSKFVVIAEGNLDVISSHQVGVRQVVATAGTAMTEGQLKGLNRFTGDVRLAYDADNAGLNATERAIPIASKVGVSLGIVTIPSGKDPDELIRQDALSWSTVIGSPQYALDWLMDRYQKLLNLATAQGKREFSDIMIATIKQLSDQVEQEHYLKKVSEVLGIAEEAVRAKYAEPQAKRRQLKSTRVHQPSSRYERHNEEIIRNENHLLAIALMRPMVRVSALKDVPESIWINDANRFLATFLQQNEEFAGKPNDVQQLQPIADHVKMLSLLHEEQYQDLEQVDVLSSLQTLKAKIFVPYIEKESQKLNNLVNEIQQIDAAENPDVDRLSRLKKDFQDTQQALAIIRKKYK